MKASKRLKVDSFYNKGDLKKENADTLGNFSNGLAQVCKWKNGRQLKDTTNISLASIDSKIKPSASHHFGQHKVTKKLNVAITPQPLNSPGPNITVLTNVDAKKRSACKKRTVQSNFEPMDFQQSTDSTLFGSTPVYFMNAPAQFVNTPAEFMNAASVGRAPKKPSRIPRLIKSFKPLRSSSLSRSSMEDVLTYGPLLTTGKKRPMSPRVQNLQKIYLCGTKQDPESGENDGTNRSTYTVTTNYVNYKIIDSPSDPRDYEWYPNHPIPEWAKDEQLASMHFAEYSDEALRNKLFNSRACIPSAFDIFGPNTRRVVRRPSQSWQK